MITNIQRFSTHDGPGIRTTVFFQGCPLRCIWCQNPETLTPHPRVVFDRSKCLACKTCIRICPKNCFSGEVQVLFKGEECNLCGDCVSACPSTALNWSSVTYTPEDVMNVIHRDAPYYRHSNGGVTLSGGEPLLQIDFCRELIHHIKIAGYHLALDTSGYADPVLLAKIMNDIDLFLFDLKIMDDSMHKKATGRSNRKIIENLKLIAASKKQVVVRLPMVPGITDSQKNLDQVQLFLSRLELDRFEPIPFNKMAIGKWEMIGIKYPLKI